VGSSAPSEVKGRRGAGTVDIVLAVMPFADVSRPSLGVSLLKAAAELDGFSAHVAYLNFGLYELLGPTVYDDIASSYPSDALVGEWFFAGDVFGGAIPSEHDYVQSFLSRYAPTESVEVIRAARAKVGAYLDEVAGRIAALGPRVVGFTSTFHQTCASLAVARRLKGLDQPPVIVFGGANCEGEMGLQLMRSFPWIDYVCSGESDVSFTALLRHLLRDGPGAIPGVFDRTRQPAAGQPAEVVAADPIENLDRLPHPDFDDYFEQKSHSTAEALGRLVVVETARGCWWGARRHCTFCGLNGQTMAFRSKSPERAYDEMVALCERYGTPNVSCVDNILDPGYIDTLFPLLATSDIDFDLFYEVKANLHYDQLVKLRDAGVRHIQPGIESLSDEVLRLMRKGVTGFQNLQLLRWCEELGIECAWNILAGFPGESPEEYEWMAETIPFLEHLRPPCSCCAIRLDRFSPLYDRPTESGIHKMRPARAYYYVYPLTRRELGRLAYFFDFDYSDDRVVEQYLDPVSHAVGRWVTAWRGPDAPRLDAVIDGDTVVVTDTRAVARTERHVLTGLPAQILLVCDQRSSWTSLSAALDLGGREAEAEEALDSLVANGLVARRGHRYLTLPVFRDRPVNSVPATLRRVDTVPEGPRAETAITEPLVRLGRSA
jgi:ribosomal peptide maturation radical SAM protein 1